jgi:predicted nucleic acid-binding protein
MAEKAVRVFLDSNVILSGLISDKGAPRIILDLLTLGLPYLQGLTGKYNILEIERNLSKKLPTGLPLYRKYLTQLHLKIIPLPTEKEMSQYAGVTAAKDVPVLVSAIKGKADFLVTGDKKDFLSIVEGMKPIALTILSPADFLNLVSGFFEVGLKPISS